MHVEHIGYAELWLGDCRDILPHLGGKLDAIVTDPPYGLGESRLKTQLGRKNLAPGRDYGDFTWDSEPADSETIELIRSISNWQIIFGGNYFSLPPSPCWLIWDKENGKSDFADGEMAWTNLPGAMRIIRWQWNGFIRKGEMDKIKTPTFREHPTQKPVSVMAWCIEKLPDACKTIVDPYMGSGSTGVAAIKAGKHFIGIEREPKYFEVACRRISEAHNQPDLFTATPVEPIQGEPTP